MCINSEKQKAPTNVQREKVQNQSHDLVSNPDSTESTSTSLNLSEPVSSLKTMGIIKIKFARSISPDYKDQTIILFIKDVLINNHLPNKECISMEAFFF